MYVQLREGARGLGLGVEPPRRILVIDTRNTRGYLEYLDENGRWLPSYGYEPAPE